MVTVILLILLLTCALFVVDTFADNKRFLNSLCKGEKDDEAFHVCIKPTDCIPALNLIKNNTIPKICGFDGDIPIICCTSQQTNHQIKKFSHRADVTDATSLSIVKKKCDDYKVHQYTVEFVPPQLIGENGTYIKREVCPVIVTLIVNGIKTAPKEFAHMALVGYGTNRKKPTWSCGGSLISEQFVLSAAHCVVESPLGPPKWVRLGELDYKNEIYEDGRPQPETIDIMDWFIHPEYHSPVQYNDIALFKLNRAVKFNAYVRPLCLYTSPTIPAHNGTVTGWGTTGQGYTPSSHLRKTTILLFNEIKCVESFDENSKRKYIPNGINKKTMVCGADPFNNRDTCTGDSGGPLQILDPNEPCMYLQIGITSFGNANCGGENSAGVYTRISHYIPWIQRIVWPTG